ncbi:alpha/beta hydrolase [Epidermidibacterium keratini]
MDPSPQLRGTIDPSARGVAVVLHGGSDSGVADNSWRRLAVLRMLPFARAISRVGGPRISVLRLRNSYYGWSKDFSEPVADAQWALDEVRRTAPGLPIALVGHSGGGRAALRLGAEPDVAAVVGLAPWIVDHDPPQIADATSVLLAHGTDDQTTDPRLTRRLGSELAARGVEVNVDLRPDGHAMLRQARHWHRETAAFVTAALL